MPAEPSPAVDHALVGRLKRCYWPAEIFDVYTREAVLSATPEPRFRDETWRGRRDPDDLSYDFGRVRFFMQQIRRGVRLDPIVVETTVYPMHSGPSVWGPPHIEDGHHRFAAAVLARSRRIAMAFGGLLSTRDWLVGTTHKPPAEIG